MPPDASPPPRLPFEEGLRRLEALVQALEVGDVDLDAGLARYEEGVGLARDLLARLDAAELRVQELALE